MRPDSAWMRRRASARAVGLVERPRLHQVGVAPDGGERRAQLVGGVGHEAAQAVLGLLALGEGELDLVDHAVEGLGEVTGLGARRRRSEAAAEVAGGDLVGGAHEVVDGAQAEADHPPGHEGEHEEHRRRTRPG